ncbi:hypothetical protein GPECTOR_2g1062 [Gonium pectorale]|uniref:Expansin-like EG45 domain-containing protein n=1 Tax=Gonium pectorale TaxID=33097 RepID=A0A150H0I5_GONPE|nr:hypothetical protein GPECTOR_2g1062 [Gonium pectorale]|eukprot:KXZ55513.1 hypothetical protein GPECTOR_2g1062 [Gonium pectorale]
MSSASLAPASTVPAGSSCCGVSPPRRQATSTPRGLLQTLSAPLLLLLAALAPSSVHGDDGGGWRTGRSTFYGQDGGATIDQGSCMYGSLPNYMVSTGVDIAALADVDPEYSGSCGRCYEVQCNPSAFSDGYGNYLDRNSACYNGATVTVTITDTCPCNYPANAYSNRRWCCGDMAHMDLSQQAFSKIANIGQGVIGIRFRQVECPGGFHPSPRAATWDFPAGTGR